MISFLVILLIDINGIDPETSYGVFATQLLQSFQHISVIRMYLRFGLQRISFSTAWSSRIHLPKYAGAPRIPDSQ